MPEAVRRAAAEELVAVDGELEGVDLPRLRVRRHHVEVAAHEGARAACTHRQRCRQGLHGQVVGAGRVSPVSAASELYSMSTLGRPSTYSCVLTLSGPPASVVNGFSVSSTCWTTLQSATVRSDQLRLRRGAVQRETHLDSSGTNFGGLFCTCLLSPMSLVCGAHSGQRFASAARRGVCRTEPAAGKARVLSGCSTGARRSVRPAPGGP